MQPDSAFTRRSLTYHAIPVAYLLLAVGLWPHPPACDFGDVDIEMYSVIARNWSRGVLPYAGLYDFKPPLTFLLLRVGFALWGLDAVVVWRLQVVLVTGTAIAVFYILLRRDRPAAAVAASAALLTLGIFDAAGLAEFLRNTELWAALPLVISLVLLSHPHPSVFQYSAFLSGLGFGLALTAKQQAGPFVLPLLWLLCHEGWSLSAPRRLSGIGRALALFCLGGCLPLVLFALYFAWYGALSVAVRAVVVHGMSYAAISAADALPLLRERLPVLSRVWGFVSQPFLVPYLVCALASLALSPRKSGDRISLLLVCLAAAPALMLSPTFYPHYLVLVFPALVFAVLQGGEILLGSAVGGRSYRTVVTLCFATGLLFGSPVAAFIRRAPLVGRCPSAEEVPLLELGSSIAARADADDRLLVWDLPPRLYLYADIPPAVRFFCVLVTFDYEDLRDDLERALASCPEFIAVSNPRAPLDWLETSAETLSQVLRDHYNRLISNSAGIIFIRRHPEERQGCVPAEPTHRRRR